MQYPDLKIRDEHFILCGCHLKLCNAYYNCKECLSIHCKLPAYCKYCHGLLLNELFLSLIRDGRDKGIKKLMDKKELKCNFIDIVSVYNDFIINNQPKAEFFEFSADFLDLLKSKKEIAKQGTKSELNGLSTFKVLYNIFIQVKLILLYKKFVNKLKLFSNLLKVISIEHVKILKYSLLF